MDEAKGRPNKGEREFEVGMDEYFKTHSEMAAGMIFANVKRTYDEYQDLALASARRAQNFYDNLNALTIQTMQNAIENANLAAKQAIRHGDIAIDCQWDPGPGEESLKADTASASASKTGGKKKKK